MHLRTTSTDIFLVFSLVVIFALFLPSCKHASQGGRSTGNQPRMSEETVIKIAKEAAEKPNYHLENYRKPKAYFELGSHYGRWTVFFDSKRLGPGDHFLVWVDDQTGSAKVMPGE